MENYVVRVWVPDRPGALGAVASRIGSVRGDVIGIDIMERGGGRAIDELIVALPKAATVELLISEIEQVDGVDVEDVRLASEALADPHLAALETASRLVQARSAEDLLASLVAETSGIIDATWAAVAHDDGSIAAVVGEAAPDKGWIESYLGGLRAAGKTGPSRADDGESGHVSAAVMELTGSWLIVHRSDRVLRARERRQLDALAAIADHCLHVLAAGVM